MNITSLFQIMEMIAIEQNFNALTQCAIEGIDLMAVKFKNIYHIFQKKPYDTLDPHVTEFDVDFVKFKTEVERLEVSNILTYYNLLGKEFMELIVSGMLDCEQATLFF